MEDQPHMKRLLKMLSIHVSTLDLKLLGEEVVHDLTVWALMAYVEFVFKVHVPASRHLHCVKQMRSSCILSFIKISKPLGSWFVNYKTYKSHPGS